MKLYCLPPSPNTVKVVALIHHLGLDVEMVNVDVQSGFLQTPEYLAKNPNGLTPLLEDGDFNLWESNAIIQYLAQKSPDSGLFPTDVKGQADVTRWFAWSQGHWGPSIRPYMFERLMKKIFRNEPPDEQVVAKAEPDFKKYAKVLEGHLSKHSHLVGDKLTVADFAVASMLIYAQPAGLPLRDFPKVADYAQRILGTEAWKKAMPQMMGAR